MRGDFAPRAAVLSLILALAACDEGKSGDTGSGCDEDGTEVVAIAIDCSFVFDGNQIDVTYEPANAPTETAVGGKLIASGALWDDPYEGRSFTMTIYAEDGTVSATTLYQMERTHLPRNEFVGDHGFTGLNWVRDPEASETLQYACFARHPSDPPHAWED